MRVWSLVSQKGGSGKTTLAINLAIAAQLKGDAVSIIDLDPQRSAEQWAEMRENRTSNEEPTVVHGTPTSLDAMLASARQTSTDLVLIDTPPAVDRSMIYAAAAADLVIVPTRADVFDEFSLIETLDYLKRIGCLHKTVAVLNAPSKDKAGVEKVRKIATETFNARLLPLTVENQPELAIALRDGRSIVETAPKKAAAKIVQKVFKELMAIDELLAKTARMSA